MTEIEARFEDQKKALRRDIEMIQLRCEKLLKAEAGDTTPCLYGTTRFIAAQAPTLLEGVARLELLQELKATQ